MVALSFALASPSSVSSSSSASVSASLRLHSPLRYLLSPPPRRSFLCCRPRPFTPLHLSTSTTPSSWPLLHAMASSNTAAQTSPSLQLEKSSLPGIDSLLIIDIYFIFFVFCFLSQLLSFFASESTSCTTTYTSIYSVNLTQSFGPSPLFSLSFSPLLLPEVYAS